MSTTNTKKIDWKALVKPYIEPLEKEVEYKMSNGKKFYRRKNKGVYATS